VVELVAYLIARLTQRTVITRRPSVPWRRANCLFHHLHPSFALLINHRVLRRSQVQASGAILFFLAIDACAPSACFHLKSALALCPSANPSVIHFCTSEPFENRAGTASLTFATPRTGSDRSFSTLFTD
jgi:hypothetical protein